MKIIARIFLVGMAVFLIGCETMHHGSGGGSSAGTSTTSTTPTTTTKASSGRNPSSGTGVTIVSPVTASKHGVGPVEICMETSNGYTVEPAKNGVNEGKGHHHLIIDTELPDLGSPIPKDAQHIHMGDGSKCKTVEFGPGVHTIRTLFAKGNHVPYNPAVTHTIFIYVGHGN